MLVAATAILSLLFAASPQGTVSVQQIDGYRRTIQSRLQSDSLTFTQAAQLFEFVDGVTRQIQGSNRAEFELFRMRALTRCADLVKDYEPRDPVEQSWVMKHEEDVIHNELAGGWLVKADLYWKLEARYRGNPFADEIAWDGAQTPIGGECEGNVNCDLALLLLTDGKYLDLYPKGAHAAEAIGHIDGLLHEVMRPNSPYTVDRRDVMELRESIARLTRILAQTSSLKKTDLIARFKQMEEIFR